MKVNKPPQGRLVREIISSIRPWRPRTRIELSQETGLSTATISRTARKLISGNLLTEVSQPSPSAGRPTRRLEINGGFGSVLGISLLPPAVRLLLLNLRGETLAERSEPIDWESSAKTLLETLR